MRTGTGSLRLVRPCLSTRYRLPRPGSPPKTQPFPLAPAGIALTGAFLCPGLCQGDGPKSWPLSDARNRPLTPRFRQAKHPEKCPVSLLDSPRFRSKPASQVDNPPLGSTIPAIRNVQSRIPNVCRPSMLGHELLPGLSAPPKSCRNCGSAAAPVSRTNPNVSASFGLFSPNSPFAGFVGQGSQCGGHAWGKWLLQLESQLP